jgi:hypothetical protein
VFLQTHVAIFIRGKKMIRSLAIFILKCSVM